MSSKLRLGVAGPVGSGKTALVEALCRQLRDRLQLAVVTHDIYTQEDAQFLTRAGALEPERIRGVETGGCPHTAIREDCSINRAAVAELEQQFPGLDLVLVAAEAEPPVCKVMDYGKHLFELKKTKAAQRKKQKQIQVKEMKFRPGTEEGDYQVKLRNLKRFLEEGDKAKVSLRFRGREVVHPEIGMSLMTRIAEDLDELGSVEAEPKFEGRQVIMVLAPRKNKKAPSARAAS